MGLYTFLTFTAQGASTYFEARELPFDSAAFPAAGELLDKHASADYVAVWEDNRPVLSRHREAPIIRPLTERR